MQGYVLLGEFVPLCAVDVSSASGWGVVVMVCLSLVSRAPVDWLADVAWRWTVQDTGFIVGTAVQICSGGYLGWKVLFGVILAICV